MQNLYPLFERNRVLKKELLWALRDYSFGQLQLEYADYGDGVLQGCGVQTEEKELVIRPGLLRYQGFVCVMETEERLEYAVTEQPVSLKLRFETDRRSLDYVLYRMTPVLDEDTVCREHELELCRFRLQAGARLRDTHTCFEDMDTEYNTLQYLHAAWGCPGGRSMAPVMTRQFAEELLEAPACGTEDMVFAWLCLDRRGAMPKEILTDYVGRKSRRQMRDASNQELFREMCRILAGMQHGEGRRQERVGRRQILVE